MARDRIGNSRNTARSLSLGTKAVVIKDAIGGNDAADVFKMSFKRQTSLDLELSGLKAPVSMTIQTQRGKSLATSIPLAKGKQVLAQTIAKGTYFLEVTAAAGETAYKLSGRALGDRAGENRKSARNVALSGKAAVFKDFVGRSDTQDYYRFALETPQDVAIALSDVSQEAKLLLLTRNGKTLTRATASKTRSGRIAQTLQPGTYYALVSYGKRSVGTAYTLTGSTTEPLIPQCFTQQWVSQFGSGSNDYAYDIDVDTEGNLYLAGLTEGTLQGRNQGDRDAFVAFANSNGQLQSIQQTGTENTDVFSGIALGNNGKLYGAGARDVDAPRLGNLSGSGDGVLSIYERSGNQLSAAQQVSFSDGDITAGADVAVDANNNVYIAGGALNIIFLSATSKAFVVKYDANGRAQALDNDMRSITNTGAATSVAVDRRGSIYVAGVTNARIQPDPENPYTDGDAFVAKFDSSGKRLWFNTLGSGETDTARRLTVDHKGNVYLVGNTEGTLPGQLASGDVDAFIAKYSTNGKRQWVRQFGTSRLDEAQGVAADRDGNIYVTGETNGALFGDAFGGSDAWIVKYDAAGRQVAATQIGTASDDETYGITTDSAGQVYVVGQTLGSFSGSNQGAYDVWVAKFRLNNHRRRRSR